MSRHKNVLLTVGILIFLIGWYYILFSWVILPTQSSASKITLVRYGNVTVKRVILKQYINNQHIRDYVLELKVRLEDQKPQKYDLPRFTEGVVDVEVELANSLDEIEAVLKTRYNNADEFYKSGLLVYVSKDYSSATTVNNSVDTDKYTHLILGSDKRCYYERAHSSEWTLIEDGPAPKMFTPETSTYSTFYNGWRENGWVIIDHLG